MPERRGRRLDAPAKVAFNAVREKVRLTASMLLNGTAIQRQSSRLAIQYWLFFLVYLCLYISQDTLSVWIGRPPHFLTTHCMSHQRESPIAMGKEEFKRIGHELIDTIAEFIDTISERPVTTGETPSQIQQVLGHAALPEHGTPAAALLTKAAGLVMNHSLLNGHPKFLGYITSSAAPIGALADLLAASINPNVGANILSPMATAIERQTIGWLAELIGVSPSYGGVLVSGGNMANFTAFLAARTAKAPKSLKTAGLAGTGGALVAYCPTTTHTWIEKAAVLFGHGSNAIRWIPTDDANKMDLAALRQAITDDLNGGKTPFLVVGTAGDVSTGAVDDLRTIAAICRLYGLWFHVDGAYGIPAAAVPAYRMLFDGIDEADSIALDPHKWLYSPLEAGCTLVKNPQHLLDTYSTHAAYYNFDGDDGEVPTHNYYECGFQNSRGFRALKVWLGLQHAGRSGYVQMINDDISLARLLFERAASHPELEAITHGLSISTLRYVPAGHYDGRPETENYLNTLNEALLNDLQRRGDVFLSNAVIRGKYCLRACVVNFRTSAQDIEAVIEIIVREGQKTHLKLRQQQGTTTAAAYGS